MVLLAVRKKHFFSFEIRFYVMVLYYIVFFIHTSPCSKRKVYYTFFNGFFVVYVLKTLFSWAIRCAMCVVCVCLGAFNCNWTGNIIHSSNQIELIESIELIQIVYVFFLCIRKFSPFLSPSLYRPLFSFFRSRNQWTQLNLSVLLVIHNIQPVFGASFSRNYNNLSFV